MIVRPRRDDERDRARELLSPRWSGETMVVRGEVFRFLELPAFVAIDDDHRWLGYVSYRFDGDAIEMMSLDAFEQERGVGSALVDAVAATGRAAGSTRLVAVTTNDNRHALAWYARRGFRVTEVRPGAVDTARALKPSIPAEAGDGSPVTDEIELVREL
jgi:ribosomal protein S18 acetylase RimI-like enzyme